MTLDTLFLAITATIYLYLGTYHQDQRGIRIVGSEWAAYRKNTALLIPGPKVARIILDDIKKALGGDSQAREKAALDTAGLENKGSV